MQEVLPVFKIILLASRWICVWWFQIQLLHIFIRVDHAFAGLMGFCCNANVFRIEAVSQHTHCCCFKYHLCLIVLCALYLCRSIGNYSSTHRFAMYKYLSWTGIYQVYLFWRYVYLWWNIGLCKLRHAQFHWFFLLSTKTRSEWVEY